MSLKIIYDEKRTKASMKKFMKGKDFSCYSECGVDDQVGGKCCKHSIIRSIKVQTEVIDEKYWKVHGYDITIRDLSDDLVNEAYKIIQKKVKKLPRVFLKLQKRIFKMVFKEVIYRLDENCSKFDEKNGLCTIYEDRPDICRVDKTFDILTESGDIKMTRKEYYRNNNILCNRMIKDQGLPDLYLIDIEDEKKDTNP